MVDAGYFSGVPIEPSRVRILSLEVAPSQSIATVELCIWDTGIVMGAPLAAGGDPLVVNDQKATRYFEHKYTLEGGRWTLFLSKETSEMLLEVDQCPA
jgi:hypothetical protein